MSLNLDKSNWEPVRFGEVVKHLNETVRDASVAGIDRVIGLEHLDSGLLEVARWGDDPLSTTFTKRVRRGQTLFGKRRAYQRKAAYAEFDAVTSGDILTFEAVPGRLVPELLPFLVQSEPFFANALETSAGSLSPRTNWRDLAKFEFALPPLPVQRRLADLLWAAEHHRRARSTAALAATRLERDFASSALTLPGEKVRIEDLGSVLMGRQRSPEHASGDHMRPYLRVANVGDNELKLDDVNEMNFTPKEYERYSIEVGDIMVSEGQSRELVGQATLVIDELPGFCFQNTLIRFRPERVRSEMAFALVRALFYSGKFAAIASQTTSIAHLGVRRFATCEVPLPEPAESTAYLERLDAIGATSAATHGALTATKALQARLLTEAFE